VSYIFVIQRKQPRPPARRRGQSAGADARRARLGGRARIGCHALETVCGV